jgi:hypothetical protein
MPSDDSTPRDDDRDNPSLRQRLHAATGDRTAEAEALADRAGDDVDEADAEAAVRRAHGDIRGDEDPASSDLASPADAEAVREERAD